MSKMRMLDGLGFTDEQVATLVATYSENTLREGAKKLKWKLSKASVTSKFGYMIAACKGIKDSEDTVKESEPAHNILPFRELRGRFDYNAAGVRDKIGTALKAADPEDVMQQIKSAFPDTKHMSDEEYVSYLKSEEGPLYLKMFGLDKVRPFFKSDAYKIYRRYLSSIRAQRDANIKDHGWNLTGAQAENYRE